MALIWFRRLSGQDFTFFGLLFGSLNGLFDKNPPNSIKCPKKFRFCESSANYLEPYTFEINTDTAGKKKHLNSETGKKSHKRHSLQKNAQHRLFINMMYFNSSVLFENVSSLFRIGKMESRLGLRLRHFICTYSITETDVSWCQTFCFAQSISAQSIFAGFSLYCLGIEMFFFFFSLLYRAR